MSGWTKLPALERASQGCPRCPVKPVRLPISAPLAVGVRQLEDGLRHVIADSPGTPDSVKGYLRALLAGEQEGGGK